MTLLIFLRQSVGRLFNSSFQEEILLHFESKMSPRESAKKRVLTQLFEECCQKNNFVFNNTDVRRISSEGSNHFDMTKIDSKEKLPDVLVRHDYAVVHLGSGNHKFVKGINNFFHDFEPIQTKIPWEYRKSILNLTNDSESNILSVANNQRILHDFLFGQDTEFDDVDITKRPKTYFPHRTKITTEYHCGEEKLCLDKQQIEIDLTIEFKGIVGVFEAKNGSPSSFSVYQIYHPFLYYCLAKQQNSCINGKIKKIYGVYVVREDVRLSLWKYAFEEPFDMATIKFLKSATYILIKPEDKQ